MTERRPGIRRLLRLGWLRATDAARDVDEEMRLHIELRAAQLMGAGMNAAEAQAEARRRFAQHAGTLRLLYATARDRNQHMRMRERWESLVQDTRYAARALRRSPLLVTFIILVLALGVGANVAAFSLVDRLLLRAPAHVHGAEGLVRMYARTDAGAAGQETSSWIPYPTYRHLRAEMQSFTAIGAYRVQPAVVGAGADARTLRVGQTLGAFFPLLGTRPQYGRFFSAEEDAAAADPLAIVSESFWRASLGADPAVIGRPLVVGEQAHTIVGIAPPGFSGFELRRVDVWVLANSRTAGRVNWHIVGRLRPGASLASASAEGAAVHGRTAQDGPGWMKGAVIFAAPTRYADTGREPVEAWLARGLALVSLIILVITLANVVNLLLARLARRRGELAVRVALGSGRARVLRLLALEGALLAAAGGLASLVVARVTDGVVRNALFAGEAAWTFSFRDARVLGMVLVIVLLTAMIVGIVPALQAGSNRLIGVLRAGAQGGPGSSRTRSALTVVQAALSVVLLVGAGLFLRSLAQVHAVDLGVDADRVVTASASLPPPVYTREGFRQAAAFELQLHRRLVAIVRRLPGVEHAAITIGFPLDGGSFSAGVWLSATDSVPVVPGRGPFVSTVGSDYFATVGTALLRGRPFTDQDREGTDPVVIVGQTMARRLWPDGDALGGCMHIGFATAPCARVVGVVADVHRVGLTEEANMQYYIPLGQQTMFSGATLLVRPRAAGGVPWPALRQAILDADPSIRAVDLRLLSAALDAELRPLRLGMVTFGLSAVLALLVAVLGLYSLMAHMVAWRTREIGIRLALGANDPQITRLVAGNGVALAGAGVLVGLLFTLAGGRWLQPHLFRTSPFDPLVLTVVAVTLLAVALLAGWIPARRAVRISPTEALRAE